jgi:hypothetical protein
MAVSPTTERLPTAVGQVFARFAAVDHLGLAPLSSVHLADSVMFSNDFSPQESLPGEPSPKNLFASTGQPTQGSQAGLAIGPELGATISFLAFPAAGSCSRSLEGLTKFQIALRRSIHRVLHYSAIRRSPTNPAKVLCSHPTHLNES